MYSQHDYRTISNEARFDTSIYMTAFFLAYWEKNSIEPPLLSN